MQQSPHNIVFDLGGVLAEISHTWQDAAKVSGVHCEHLPIGISKLTDFDAFDLYQAAAVSLEEYLNRLADYVGCKPDEALRVHNGILVVEYPGVSELVSELHSLGLRTGCLSNTNEPHWEELAINGKYPTIQSLDMKMASHLVGINKPSPAIFELYCDTFGIAPHDIAYFDDSQANVNAAANCGWNARHIDPAGNTPNQMRGFLTELGVTLANPIA